MAPISRVGTVAQTVAPPELSMPKTKLEITFNNWDSPTEESRKIELDSVSEDSLLKLFILHRFLDGRILLQLCWDKNNSNTGAFKALLSSNGLDSNFNDYIGSTDADEIKKIFKLLKPYLEIEGEMLKKISEIIENYDYRSPICYGDDF